MAVAIQISGLDELRAKLLVAIARAEELTKVATVTGLALIDRAAKSQLGKTSHSKGTPTPSGPGSPPSLVSGALRRSVTLHGPVGGGGTWTGSVAPTSIYARIQELGGLTGRNHATRLPARPYMEPALEESKADIYAQFTSAWSRIFD